jgi:glutamate dehydrogenase/leucine dehydrogenase
VTRRADLISERDDQQLVCVARDGDDAVGYIAIDSTVDGRARGGLREIPGGDVEEVGGLSRSRSLK